MSQIIITEGNKLKGIAMPKIVKDFQAAVVGRRIKAAGYFKDDDGEFVIPCLVLDNDTIIMSGADDEGNGSGVLQACTSDSMHMLCETEAK